MRHLMVGLAGVLALSGCASSSKFISNLDNAPSWFLDQVQDADAQGYPNTAETPPQPDDIPELSYFDDQLQELKAQGARIAASPLADRSDMPTKQDTEKFVDEAREYTDVQKYNDEEEARLAQLRAEKKKK